jgi:glutathione S-transferase
MKHLADCEIRLFGVRLSPFVEKVVRALQLKDVPFELVPLKSPADFKRWNPQTGKMPVLEIDGERFIDSTFILRVLDERAPEPPLFAADPETAARQRFIEDWADESLYWYVLALRWIDENANATLEQVAASLPVPGFLRAVLKPMLRRQIRSIAVAQGMVRLPPKMILEELDRRFTELEVMLGNSPFFFSNLPGAADVAVFGQLCTLRSGPTPQGATVLDAHACLCDHYHRVEQATVTARVPRRGVQSAA